MRLVRPVLVKAMPIIMAPKMNITEGSMKSRKASLAGRMANSAWKTPMAMAVTPMGMTSNTHQMPAIKNSPMAALPSGESAKCLPAGSMASAQGGAK